MTENFEYLPGQRVNVIDVRTAETWAATITAVWAGGKVLEVRRDTNQLLYSVGVGFCKHIPRDSELT